MYEKKKKKSTSNLIHGDRKGTESSKDREGNEEEKEELNQGIRK